MRSAKRWTMWVLVLASIAWTVTRWNTTYDSIKSYLDARSAVIVVSMLIVAEIAFVVGGIILAWAASVRVFKDVGPDPRNWIRRILQVRKSWREYAEQAKDRRAVQLGLGLNLFGALFGVTGLTPVFVFAVALPPSGWGVMAPFLIDVVATLVLRRSIWAGFNSGREVWADDQGPESNAGRLADVSGAPAELLG